MAKTAFFRSAMFGYSKSEVNEFIARQNERNVALKNEVSELESRFEQYRRYYESLLRLHQDNLAVLKEVRVRAARSEENISALQNVFQSVSKAHRELYEFANKQQNAVMSARVYEDKARKYEELAHSMREMILPGEHSGADDRLPVLDLPQSLPDSAHIEGLLQSAKEAFGALSADAQAFFTAADRLQIPGKPEEQKKNASSL